MYVGGAIPFWKLGPKTPVGNFGELAGQLFELRKSEACAP